MRILKDALIILYVIIAILSTILLLSFNKYKVSVFGDYSIVIVDSNELQPSFSKGDMVIVKSSDMYRVGENVFFYNIVERKVEVTLANISKVEEVTDGMSAYEIPGGALVSHDEVIGSTANVKVFHKIGSFIRFIESKYGYLILIVIPSGVALLYEIYYLVVTRKEEIEEEKEEEERRKRLAKKRAKERLLAKKQQEEGITSKVEDDIFEEDIEDVTEEEKEEEPEVIVNDRKSLKASIEQNKKAYEEKIRRLKSNYDKKVEKHPEIDDDDDLKVTNQSKEIEKANDLKEKANDEASNVVRKVPRHSATVRRRIPTHASMVNKNNAEKIQSNTSPTKESEKVENTRSEETHVSTKKAIPVRRSSVSVARRAAAMKNANAEKNSNNSTENKEPSRSGTTNSSVSRATVRRGTRIQSKKILNSRKVDEKD